MSSEPSKHPVEEKAEKKEECEVKTEDIKDLINIGPQLPPHHFTYPLFTIFQNKNSSAVIVGGGGGTAKTGIINEASLWVWESQKEIYQLRTCFKFTNSISCGAFHPQKENLAFLGVGPDGYIIDTRNGAVVWKAQIDQDKTEFTCVKTIKFTPDGSAMYVGGVDGVVRKYDFPPKPDTNPAAEFPAADARKDLILQEIDDMDLNDNFLITTTKSTCRVWDLKTGQCASLIAPSGSPKMVFQGCCFSRRDLFVGLVVPKTSSQIWKWNSFKQSTDIQKKPTVKVTAFRKTHHTFLATSPDGTYLVTASGQNEICMFYTSNLSSFFRARPHKFVVTGAVISEDLKNLTSASIDYSVVVTPIIENNNMSLFTVISALIVLFAVIFYYIQ